MGIERYWVYDYEEKDSNIDQEYDDHALSMYGKDSSGEEQYHLI